VTEPLLVDRTDAVVTLTLNRPAAMNALDVALKEALRDALAELETDRSCRAVVLAGAGGSFSAGQDLREHVQTLESATTDPLHTVRAHYNPIAARLANLPKPVVAAVRGMAAGAGASLAFLADFRIGGPKPGSCGVRRVKLADGLLTLPRLVGHAKAVSC
jgi:2-(1,2-epoxy-1,2-dihydrophenyl)acetyl-CoA isomerase